MALIELKNQLLAEERYTDAVDDRNNSWGKRLLIMYIKERLKSHMKGCLNTFAGSFLAQMKTRSGDFSSD
jgi:hypothetical protein